MIADVKYSTGEIETVDTSFIKNFNKDNVDSYRPGKTIRVFWSPNDDDTPEKVLRKQGVILDIGSNLRRSGSKQPITGYYEAELLSLAETDEKLRNSKKRLILPSEKKKDNEAKDEKKKAAATSKTMKSQKQLQASSERRNIEAFVGASMKHSRKASATSSDDDEEVAPTKELKVELKRQKKSNSSLKEKNLQLSSKVELLETLLKEANQEIVNLNLQLAQVKKNPFPGTPHRLSPYSSPIRFSPRLQKKIVPQTPPSSRKKLFVDSPVKSISPMKLEKPKTPIKLDLNENPANPNTSTNLEPPTSSAEKIYKITEDQYSEAKMRVKTGIAGDSLFTKNLAFAIFGPETLMMSSVTGEQCRSKSKDVKPAKPALPSKGMTYLIDVLPWS